MESNRRGIGMRTGAVPLRIVVDDDAPMRTDVDSDDVRTVHPDLPDTPHARNEYLARRDDIAYGEVCQRFPQLLPPHRTKR